LFSRVHRKDVETGQLQRLASDAENKSKMVYREEAEGTNT